MQPSLSIAPLTLCLVGLLGTAAHPQEAATPAAPGTAAQAGVEGAAPARLEAPKDSSQYNRGDDGLAIEGYDPVSYFPEGGGKPAKGKAALDLVLNGMHYRFASEEHKKLFEQNPGRYIPAFGGWCAFAMAKGDKVEVDPESFIVDSGRLLLFYNGIFNDTRASWLKDVAKLQPQADEAWKKLTGEEPRDDKAAAKAATQGGDAAAGGAAAVAAVGTLAPAFTLKDKAGVEHSLADYQGKLVVLDFWATWCGPCKAAMPGLQKLHERFADKGVVVIGVDGFERDAKADPAGYMASKGYTYQLLLGDAKLGELYAIEALPTFVVIDENGRILARQVGKPDDEGELPALIEKHLASRGT